MGLELIPAKDRRKRLSYLSSVMARDPELEQDREKGGYVIKTPANSLDIFSAILEFTYHAVSVEGGRNDSR